PVTATATAAGTGGIQQVDFYANDAWIGTATASPYSYTWPSVGPGSYALTAIATDTLGIMGSSSPVNVTVNAPAGYADVARAANGGVATASSSYSNAFPPASVNDGDRRGLNWGSGGGWADATPGSFPDWVEVDFNGAKVISEVDVFSVQDNFAFPSVPTE